MCQKNGKYQNTRINHIIKVYREQKLKTSREKVEWQRSLLIMTTHFNQPVETAAFYFSSNSQQAVRQACEHAQYFQGQMCSQFALHMENTPNSETPGISALHHYEDTGSTSALNHHKILKSTLMYYNSTFSSTSANWDRALEREVCSSQLLSMAALLANAEVRSARSLRCKTKVSTLACNFRNCVSKFSICCVFSSNHWEQCRQ